MAKKKALGKGLRALIPEGRADALREPGPRVVDVELDRIAPNPTQPRTTFREESMAELAASIKSQGVLQPVTLKRAANRYYVVIGERRVRAARQVGLRTIPAVVRDDVDDHGMLELALVENIQREDLPPLELAEAYRILQDEHGLTQQEIARRVGKSRETVANTMRLLGLPRLIREYLGSGEISAGHAKALLGLPSDRLRLQVARMVVQRRLSVRQAEEVVRKAARPAGKPREPAPVSADVAQMLEELQRKYATRVTLAQHRGRGKLEIHFYSEEELGRVLELLLA